MSKFEFLVKKLSEPTWEHRVIIRANEKLNAFAIIMDMFPKPEFEYEFKGTC